MSTNNGTFKESRNRKASGRTGNDQWMGIAQTALTISEASLRAKAIKGTANGRLYQGSNEKRELLVVKWIRNVIRERLILWLRLLRVVF